MKQTVTILLLLLFAATTKAQTVAAGDTATVEEVKKYEVRKSRNIIVVDSGMHTRAFEPFGSLPHGAEPYAEMVNEYKRRLGDSVTVYCMTVPNAVAYYCPEEQQTWTRPEKPVLDNLYRHLSDSVIGVRIYDVLKQHTSEPIYSRTDHHWAPLGAYYAAGEFARAARVDFKPLSAYEKKTVRGYVGSMYTFSKDMAVKKAPEDFIYYEPQGIDYKAYFTNYTVAKGRTVGESKPEERNFFIHYKDGSAGAYCCFMGGDTHTVRVVTGVKNHRRLMILKDSYGNAVASNLFYGFEEVHVVDFRYFPHNILEYVRDNAITDVLFCNNLIHACSASTARKYRAMLDKK